MNIAIQRLQFRVLLKLRCHALQHIVRREEIIRIKHTNHVARSSLDALIHGIINAIVLARKNIQGLRLATRPVKRRIDTVFVSLTDSQRVIFRTAVLDDVFHIRILLLQYAS